MKLYEVPDERRYWVVRADSGKYYDHFVQHGVIALAHLDILELDDIGDKRFAPTRLPLAQKLFEKHQSEDIKKGTTTSHVNQIKSFIMDMGVGDWILTIGKKAIRFGRIIGTPRLNRTPLIVRYGKDNEREVSMKHNLRRAVAWGPELKRDTLPYSLQSSMKAYQAVFNVDQHWEAIYHTLYSVFKKNEELYFSIKVNSKDRINNYYVTSLLNYLNEIEVIAKYADEESGISNFDSFFREHAMSHGVSTTTKASFHSPGEFWTAVETGLKNHPVKTVLLSGYILLFGNSLLGFDGIIDVETRRNVWEMVLERYERNQIEEVAEKLKLSKPNVNTAILESDALDEAEELPPSSETALHTKP